MTFPVSRHPRSAEWPDPLAEFAELHDRLGQLLPWVFSDRGGTRPLGWIPPWSPATDLSESAGAYLVDVNLPGLARDEITIEIDGEDVVITGDFKDPERPEVVTVRRRARPFGRFESRTTLPGPFRADDVRATLTNGVLTVTLPKDQAPQRRQIHISAD